ncbi:hypothetical protein B0H12DRAFT_1329352 [Mycena haematopus]|nr:hypothetical protein B0H12DRAFT_1329352 [Mycena haematopus]
MQLSVKFILIALAIVAPVSAAVVARVEGEVTDTPGTWLSIEHGISYSNSTTELVARTGAEVVSCYGSGTKADRALSYQQSTTGAGDRHHRLNGQTLYARYNYGSFTVYVSGAAINGCNFVIDGNCNRLLRLPVDKCNTGGENGKQGGVETDLCGQWRTDPGCCGSDL